ncbi:MAG: methyltransferase domain-containing protein [Bacteroidetes bacterium]|jgi:SAM-dependent methyltransferase|nr:methyltransferase domain-containing protein [Bacteroidota bacterium]
MAKTAPFDTHPDRYDTWFDRNDAAYASELGAFQALLPDAGRGLEIGVGTGRFAAPLGIQHGVDPSPEMRDRARERGITVEDGIAEALPYPDAHFDKALMTTTLCYLDDPEEAFREAYRVLRPRGTFVVGFVDGGHPLGQRYTHSDNTFYEDASFHRPPDVRALLETAGFGRIAARQTLFTDDPSAMETPDPVREGVGAGGFVVMRGSKPA